MTSPFGPLPNGQGGPPQGGQGPGFGPPAGLPAQQANGQGYVPQYGQPPQQQQQPQQQPIPPMHQMPNTDAIQFPAPYFPPPQPQQQPNGFPAPQQQPHQQGGFAQQLGYGQQPQQNPQGWTQLPMPPAGGQPQQQQQAPQQQQQQRPQAPTGAIQQDHLGRLWGPGLPPTLQGATFQQVQAALGLQQQAPQGQQQFQQRGFQQMPQPQFQQQQPQQQAPQTPTQQGQVAAQAPPKSFWADPEGAIERIVEQRMAPMNQAAQITAVQAARDAVAGQYPEFAQYENDVIARMQGLDPQLLGNPQAWRIAFEQAVGERYLQQMRGGGNFRQPNGQQQVQQPAAQGWQPYQAQSPVQQPRYGDFFTESPSAGYQGVDGQFGAQAAQLTPQQLEAARRFGMSPQQYLQGMGARY